MMTSHMLNGRRVVLIGECPSWRREEILNRLEYYRAGDPDWRNATDALVAEYDCGCWVLPAGSYAVRIVVEDEA